MVGPGIFHCHGSGHQRRREHHGVGSGEACRCRGVFPGLVADDESGEHTGLRSQRGGEFQHQFVTLALDALAHGSGIHARLVVRAVEGYQTEPTGHLLLVHRVDVAGIAEVDGHGHAGLGKHKRIGLSLTQSCPLRVGLHQAGLKPAGELHEVEGEFLLSPVLAPCGDHVAEQRPVLLGAPHVGATLIPQHAAQRHAVERIDHGVVEHRRVARALSGHGMRRDVAQIGGHGVAPVAGQRYALARCGLGIVHVGGAAESAGAVKVGDAHGEHVGACLHQLAGHGVVALIGPAVHAAHLGAVEIGHILIVHGAEMQRQVLVSVGCGHIYCGLGPNHAVESGQHGVFPLAGHRHSGPTVAALQLGFVESDIALEQLLLPLGAAALVVGLQTLSGKSAALQGCHLRLKALDTFQVGERGPRLGGSAAPRRVDHAHRHLQRVADLLGKEIGDGREVHGRGVGLGPAAHIHLGVVERCKRGVFLDLQQAYLGVKRGGHHLVGIHHLPPPFYRELHVALARAEPHLAAEHILQHCRRIAAVAHDDGVRASGLGGGELQQESSLRIGLGGGFSLVTPVGGGCHRGSGVGGAGDGEGGIALHHHVVGVKLGQSHLCLSAERRHKSNAAGHQPAHCVLSQKSVHIVVSFKVFQKGLPHAPSP